MEWPVGKLRKYRKSPILGPIKKSVFESSAVYNPTAIKKEEEIDGDGIKKSVEVVYLFYRAEQNYYNSYVSRICLATSKDGINFTRYDKNPIIVPEKKYEKRGCEDPRITEIDGKYFMTYVAFSGRKANVALAESYDLLNWKKRGIIMKNAKSGALLPKKINNEYVLYFGDVNIYIAYSGDLRNWRIRETPILSPRKDNFDSKLVEIGPSPILTEKGFFIVYNSSDGEEYNVGFAMLNGNNPEEVVQRCEKPMLSATKPWESYGKVNYVVFADGIVEIAGKYYLYYGGADKSIGLSIGEKRY